MWGAKRGEQRINLNFPFQCGKCTLVLSHEGEVRVVGRHLIDLVQSGGDVAFPLLPEVASRANEMKITSYL